MQDGQGENIMPRCRLESYLVVQKNYIHVDSTAHKLAKARRVYTRDSETGRPAIVGLYQKQYTGCFKKVAPKTFRNIFTSVKSFCVKCCKFVGNLYPHTSTNFCRFILIFHQMALIFPRGPIVFILSSFEYSPRK